MSRTSTKKVRILSPTALLEEFESFVTLCTENLAGYPSIDRLTVRRLAGQRAKLDRVLDRVIYQNSLCRQLDQRG